MKNTDSLRTTHFQIFDYWKDKEIYPDGTVKVGYDSESIPVVNDWGEPMCWCCGEPIVGEYEKSKPEEIDYKLLWNDKVVKRNLNRCHIIPRALGGGVEPDNLFLMCEVCHKESPDTTNYKAFFRWIYQKKKHDYLMGYIHPEKMWEEVDEELERRGLPCLMSIINNIPKEDVKDIDLFDNKQIHEYMDENLGMHGFQISHYGTIVVLTDYLLEKLQKYVGEQKHLQNRK